MHLAHRNIRINSFCLCGQIDHRMWHNQQDLGDERNVRDHHGAAMENARLPYIQMNLKFDTKPMFQCFFFFLLLFVHCVETTIVSQFTSQAGDLV